MIYTTHGVVDNYNSEKFCHKNFLDTNQFVNYLRRREKKYVSLKMALDGHDDAFTIDDSTYAAYQAAKLLISNNHQVTLFVNPYYIENKIDYWFLKLNYLLDHSLIKFIKYKDVEYPLYTYKEKLIFRKKLKADISGLPTEEERQYILGGLFKIPVKNLKLPFYLKTITETDLLELYKLGVDIQNHGWTHRELEKVEEIAIEEEIKYGKKWIKDKLNHNANFYCVPFGNAFPSFDSSSFTCWFLLNGFLKPGFNGKKIYNRLTLDLK